MVFARTKLMMQDNCFEQEPGDVTMEYIGPNPQKIYNNIFNIMKSIFRVADSDIQEEKFSWGKKEVEKFKTRIYLQKEMDKFSYLQIRIDLSGQGAENNGNAKVKIKSILRTEYPEDTVWQRSLFYEFLRTLWHNLFYHQSRANYTEECRHYVILFQKRMFQLFKKLQEQYE